MAEERAQEQGREPRVGGPATPWAWLVAGLVVEFIGASILFTALEYQDDDSIQPLVGTVIMALGGVLVLIGAAAVGTMVAMRRHAFELAQREQRDDPQASL